MSEYFFVIYFKDDSNITENQVHSALKAKIKCASLFVLFKVCSLM